MEKNNQDLILPDIIVVKFDETRHWREDIQEKAGKIFSYYVINRSEITHLAETNGSYYCHFLYNRVENTQNFLVGEGEDYSDELIEIENGYDNDDPNMYVSEHTKLEIVDDKYCQSYSKSELEELIIEDGLEEFIAGAIEYYQGNPVE